MRRTSALPSQNHVSAWWTLAQSPPNSVAATHLAAALASAAAPGSKPFFDRFSLLLLTTTRIYSKKEGTKKPGRTARGGGRGYVDGSSSSFLPSFAGMCKEGLTRIRHDDGALYDTVCKNEPGGRVQIPLSAYVSRVSACPFQSTSLYPAGTRRPWNVPDVPVNEFFYGYAVENRRASNAAPRSNNLQ
jgi:hypothetical protein